MNTDTHVIIFNEWKEWTLRNKTTPRKKATDPVERRLYTKMKWHICEMKKFPEIYQNIILEYNLLMRTYGPFKTKEQRFEEWKNWVMENKKIPSCYSKDKTEASIAKNMKSIIASIKASNESDSLLLEQYNEFREKYLQMNPMKSKAIAVFDEWRQWSLSHKKTPRRNNNNPSETTLCNRIQHYLRFMKKNKKDYEDILLEYESIMEMYGGNKTKEQHFKEWEKWVVVNKRLPSAYSSDKKEANMYGNISHILQIMRKEPEKYEELLRKYDEIYQEYAERTEHLRGNLCYARAYDEWKKFVIENERLPSGTKDNTDEKKLLARFNNALKNMKKQSETFKTQLEECEELTSKYKDARKEKKRKAYFAEYKEWILSHNRFPYSKAKDEKNLAWRMGRIFKEIRANPDIYFKEIGELDELVLKYKKRKSDSSLKDYEKANKKKTVLEKNLEILTEWLSWVHQNNRLPSCSNSYEKALGTKFRYALNRLKKGPDNQNEMVKECEKLYLSYKEIGRRKRVIGIIEKWKQWCTRSGRLPQVNKYNKQETNMYNKMSACISYIKQKSEMYEDVLQEYNNFLAQYVK